MKKSCFRETARREKASNRAFSYSPNDLGTQGSTCFEEKVWYEIKKNAHFSKYMIFNCNEIRSENV